MAQLRIALTLPGEASLGTFEAGAVSALVLAVLGMNEETDDAVRIDIVTGASSGALTAVLAARALVAGQDPIAPLRRAWVTEPTLEALRRRAGAAPLSLERAREVARELLADRFDGRGKAQGAPVTLELALGSLRGFNYRIRRLRRPAVPATSYVDWSRHTLSPADAKGFTATWAATVDSAIASASHPLAFPATVLDRQRQRRDYERNGVVNLPKGPLDLWYVDGGLVDRQPLGRCLDLVQEEDRGAANVKRLVVVIHADTDRAPGSDDPAWTDRDKPPRWTATLARALRLVARHTLYEDLRRVVKTNNQLELIGRLVNGLGNKLPNDQQTRDLLESVIGEAKRGRRGAGAPPGRRGAPPVRTVPELFEDALLQASGLQSKVKVDVEVVTGDPAQIPGGALGSFNGFLAERPRAQGFLVGYRAMLAFLEDPGRGLVKQGVPRAAAVAGIEAARAGAADVPGWVGGTRARRRVTARNQIRVWGVGLRAARIGLRGRARRH